MVRIQDERSPFEKMAEMTNGEVRSQKFSVEKWILLLAGAQQLTEESKRTPLSIDCVFKYTSKCDV